MPTREVTLQMFDKVSPDPSSKFTLTEISASDVKRPISRGIDPLRLLYESSSTFSSVKFPTEGGQVQKELCNSVDSFQEQDIEDVLDFLWKIPQILKIANFKWNNTGQTVSEKAQVLKLCQLHNLYWYCTREVVIAQVQKSELKEGGDSRWYHSAQTIVLQIDANQEESSKEDDRPLIFHLKRASASSLFACEGASKHRM
nr:hypothetical protein CCACVL1_30839 [Ipomoea batatas]GMC99594.1 hypothetical protein CCACVL1_30839 [Ipomoea batatas]